MRLSFFDAQKTLKYKENILGDSTFFGVCVLQIIML